MQFPTSALFSLEKIMFYGHLSCDRALTMNETLKWLTPLHAHLNAGAGVILIVPVQCCFTSTETLRTGSPGRPPGPFSHSSGALLSVVVECCFTSTETVGLLGTGAQDVNLDFHTCLLYTSDAADER